MSELVEMFEMNTIMSLEIFPQPPIQLMTTNLSTHHYIDFLHRFENLLASTKFVKEWLIKRNEMKEIEIQIMVDKDVCNEAELWKLYRLAQVLGSMAVSVQNFAGARCYIRDTHSKKHIPGFEDIIIQ